ncbi:MAG: hypothetical protein V8T01_09865 [Oscillospiraceae bacterium]
MRKSQRLLSLLLAAVLLGLLPASALGANTTPRVHVTVENTTYTEANAASDWIARHGAASCSTYGCRSKGR